MAADLVAWHQVMPELAERFTVIAFDLPGLGESAVPRDGFDKVTAADRIRTAVHRLGFREVSIIGHDMGGLVGFPYARDYPAEVRRFVLMDTPLPGFPVEGMYDVGWHIMFNMMPAPFPEKVKDNDDVRVFLDMVFHLSPNGHLIDARPYYRAYGDPTKRSAGYNYYRAFYEDAENNQANAARRLPMPVLAMGAQHTLGQNVAASIAQAADHVRPVVVPTPELAGCVA